MVITDMKKVPRLIVIAVFSVLSSALFAQSLEDLLGAVEKGQPKQVAALLDRGLDVNTTDKSGHSILMLAARMGHREVVSLLLSRKASLSRRSPVGDTALMMASLRGDLEIVRLLVGAGAEVNHEGWTPLHYAAFEGAADVARFLLEKGANKDAVAPNGYTPLMLAGRNGKAEAATVILYADPDVNFRTESGDTALKIARERGMAPLVELLRRAGAVE